jgi:hypothetical protein
MIPTRRAPHRANANSPERAKGKNRTRAKSLFSTARERFPEMVAGLDGSFFLLLWGPTIQESLEVREEAKKLVCRKFFSVRKCIYLRGLHLMQENL